MSKQSRVVRQISARAEVEAKFALSRQEDLKPRIASAAVLACQERTIAVVMTLGAVGPTERAARTGWLRLECRRCGGCELAR